MSILFYMNSGKKCLMLYYFSENFNIVWYELWQKVGSIVFYQLSESVRIVSYYSKIIQLLFSKFSTCEQRSFIAIKKKITLK